jgi:signal transduction histidine kinase
MIWNWLRRHPRLVDLGLVVLLLAETAAVARHTSYSATDIVLSTAATLALFWRRDRPVAVVTVVTALMLVSPAAAGRPLPFQLAVALYTLAAVGGAAARPVGLASIATSAVALVAHGEAGDGLVRIIFAAAAWLLGDSLRSRRSYLHELEEKAARLERERETEARRAAAEEQARIARELHDLIAHALGVIVVQAGAADDVFDTDPARARGPIKAIDTAARTALADLRRVLGLLQPDADYAPQPGLDQLEPLVDQVRATGLEVSLRISGARRPLPATVDLSAYRIVQEALTNVLKHANADHVDVRIGYGDELAVQVRDDGSGKLNGNGAGSGLIGMRERVALLGGSVEAGSPPGGGYLVSATIPIEGST